MPIEFGPAMLGFTAMALSAVAAHCAGIQSNDGVTVRYAIANTESITAKEPVLVKAVLENSLSERVTFDFAHNREDYPGFEATLVRPDGRIEQTTKLKKLEAASVRTISIEPLGSAQMDLLVTKWFDFDIPGDYVLEVRVTTPPTRANGVPVPCDGSGHLVIPVGQRDPVRLQQVCAALERRISEPSAGASPLDNVWALTHVRDPVAIFYIDRLLWQDERLSPDLIAGLEGIGGGLAIEALISRLSNPDRYIRAMARQALIRTKERTPDPLIKGRIEQALGDQGREP